MFLTKLDNNQTFTSIYRSLLAEAIDGTNTQVKQEIDQAILEAYDVICGKKEAYLISNEHFYFTNFLISNQELLGAVGRESKITPFIYQSIATALNT